MFYQSLLRGLITAMFLLGMISTVNARIINAPAPARETQFDFRDDDDGVLMDGNPRSFLAALQEMDKIVQDEVNKQSCRFPQKPNFRVDGRRISEEKCLDYIWYMKRDEGEQILASKCPELSGITGGQISDLGEYPHMGAIGWNTTEAGKYNFSCGGSLISEKFVLTAAHCTRALKPAIVRFGVVNLNEAFARDIKVEDFLQHHKYRPGYNNYDIAIIKLARKVKFTKKVNPACILNQPYVNEAIITGWGATTEQNNNKKIGSNDLLKAEVDVLPDGECQKKWEPKYFQSEWENYFEGEQICAINLQDAGDVCGGDSGGPIQTELHVRTSKSTGSIYNIVGVTSLGAFCGSKTFPSVYTKVNFHLDWIEQIVWSDEFKNSSENEINSNFNLVTPSIIETSTETDGVISDIQHLHNGARTMEENELNAFAENKLELRVNKEE